MKERALYRKENFRFWALLCTILLVISTFSVIGGLTSAEEIGDDEDIVLIRGSSESKLRSLEREEKIEIIDSYGENILASVSQDSVNRLQNTGLDVDTLPSRTEISVKGHTFDVAEGSPEIGPDLEIDGYDPGQEGLYLVHMLGPVNPEWITTLEDKGVDVINYVPNYAYEVSMTPEQAEEVEDKFFVDWVGIYQPEYKIHPDVEPGNVNVHLRPDFELQNSVELIRSFDEIDKYRLQESEGPLTLEVESEEQIESLAMVSEVYYIEPSFEPRLHGEMDIQTVGGGLWFMDDGYGHPNIPYRKHGDYGAYINQIGYSGDGMTVAVADSGLGDGTIGDSGVEDFTDRVIGGYSFGDDIGDWGDGMYHGTATGGLIAGDTHRGTGDTFDEYDGFAEYYMGQGLAYESELFAAKIFNAQGDFLPNDYYEIVEKTVEHSDAYIHSNSWGANTMGQYIETDSIFDQAVRDANRDTEENRPMIITASAGNSGGSNMFEEEIGSPGNAKNLITVGGSQPYNPTFGHENPENMYSASSRGWTEDNRVKPDIIAPAQDIITHNTPLDGGGYVSTSGTSFSNPLVAGAASIVAEWYNSTYGGLPSPSMVRSILINTANDLDPEGTSRGHIPNRDEGWGMTDISKLEYPREDPTDFMLKDQESLLATGEQDEFTVSYQNEDEPLKFTLAWTDKEAQPGDSAGGNPTLKNNLDLEVISPEGDVYRGNAFDVSGDGQSDSGFTHPNTEAMQDFDHNEDGWDDVNNVQNVFIPSEKLEGGNYRVVVHGTNIPQDSNGDGEPNQDYALTAYNVPYIDEPSKDGEITLDRPEYSGDDTIGITLSDYDLMGDGTHTVDMLSELDEELLDEKEVTLYEDEDTLGLFEGQIETTTDPSEEDQLYVEHGAEVTVRYLDEDPGPLEEELSIAGSSVVNDDNGNDPTVDTGVVEIVSPVTWINSEYSHPVESVVENFGTEDQTDVPVETTINEMVPMMNENFSGDFPPEGWDTLGWQQSDDNEAGGEPPEALLDPLDEHAYLTSREVDTSETEKISLEFKSYIDHDWWGDPIDARVEVRSDAEEEWEDITPWENPVDQDIGPDTFSMDISDHIGSATQVRFEFEGGTADLDYWAVDDVIIYREPVRYFDETTADVEAGETTTAEFEPWNPGNEGQFYMNSTTMMDWDENPHNDYLMQDILVEDLHDVGVEEIVSPLGIPPSDRVPEESQPVEVILENHGSFDEESVPVSAVIDKVPEMLFEDFVEEIPDTWAIDGLVDETWEHHSTYEAATIDEVGDEWMDEWLISPAFDASDAEETMLEFDHRLFNGTFGDGTDNVYGRVMVSADGGDSWELVEEFSPPGGESDDGVREYDISGIADGSSEVKTAFVYNSSDEASDASWRIREARVYYEESEYTDQMDIELGKGQEKAVSFDDWTPSEEERYRLNFSVDLQDDMDPSNDHLTEVIFVETVRDLAAEELLSPVGTVPLDTHDIIAEIDNRGNIHESDAPVKAEITRLTELLHEDFFQEIPEDWTVDSISETTWEHDVDWSDNHHAHIEGAEEEWQDESLITPSFDSSDAEGANLRIEHDFDLHPWDPDSTAEILISGDDGDSWEQLDFFDESADGVFEYDVSDHIDGEDDVRLSFVFNSTDTEGQGDGDEWEIHDVLVYHEEEEHEDEVGVDIDVGDPVEVTFADWEPSSETRYLVNITTMLEDDADPSNIYLEEEILVRTVHDVGTNEIISPTGTVRTEMQEVIAEVENFGNIDEPEVPVLAEIDRLTEVFYEDFEEEIPDDWTIEGESASTWHHDVTWGGDHIAYIEGTLNEDKEEWLITPSIDASDISGAVLEVEHDFNNQSGYGSSTGEIMISDDGGDSWEVLDTFVAEESGVYEYDISDTADGQSDVRIAYVFDSGVDAESYDDWEIYDTFVYYREEEYEDEKSVELTKGEVEEIVFDDWGPSDTEVFEIDVHTDLEEDQDTSNDRVVERVTVTDKIHDIGIEEITHPEASVWDESQLVEAEVTNYGDYYEEDVPIVASAERVKGIMEDFSGEFPPEGWETDDWWLSDSNNAGGLPPEAELDWIEVDGEHANLTSPTVDTRGEEELILEFNSLIDPMPDGDFESKVLVRSNLYEDWTDVTPWENPVDDTVGPDRYSIDISDHIGSGTQVRFGFEGDNSNLNSWYIDDVVLGSVEEEYSSEVTVDLDIGESTMVEFDEWQPSSAGNYIFDVSAEHPEEANPDNATENKMVEVIPIIYDLEASSIDEPIGDIYHYEQDVAGSVKNVGNQDIEEAEVEMTIEQVHEIMEMEERFMDGLPADWSVEDRNNNDNTWTDSYGGYMQVISEDDHENNVLWSEPVDATDGTHRVLLEFSSDFQGTNDRELLISTDGGETSRRIERNVGEGQLAFDLTDFVSGEEEVMIGWEFYTEEAEEDEYWRIDDVTLVNEYLTDEYQSQRDIADLNISEEEQIVFDEWDPQEVQTDYLMRMTALHEDDQNIDNSVIERRVHVEQNLPPNEPVDPSPYDGEEGVTHSPTLTVEVSDPNEEDLDVTFFVLDEDGVELVEETIENVMSDSRVSVDLEYLDSDSTFHWYVEVTDGYEGNVSDEWTFHTYEPEPIWKTDTAEIDTQPPGQVENLSVDWDGDTAETRTIDWSDDLEEVETGYQTDVTHHDASSWEIRDNDAAVGNDSWDWGDGEFNKETLIGMRSSLVSPELEIPDRGDNIEFRFQHWRDFGDTNLYDGGNLKLSTNGSEGDFEVIHPVEGYDGDIAEGYGNPLAGQPGWGGESSWEYATFDLTGYKGETIHLRWDAGTDAVDDLSGEGWRVDDLRLNVVYEQNYIEPVSGSELTWNPSPDDGAGDEDVDHYVVYRSEDGDGPWDDDSQIATVRADGSESYSHQDLETGDDETRWHYLVRAVDRVGNMEMNEETVRRPELPEIADFEPGHGDDVEGVDQELTVDVTSPTGEPLWVGFYDAETDMLIGESSGATDETVTTEWSHTEKDMGETYGWYVVASYEESDVRVISEAHEFYLKDTVEPVARAGEDIEADQGETVILDGSDSTDNLEIVEWEWMIEEPTGEETVKYGEIVEYTLENALTYDVELTVYDEEGNTGTDTMEIYAVDTEDPVAEAGSSDRTRLGVEYTFDGSGSTDNVEVVGWSWTIEGVSGEADGFEDTVEGEIAEYEFQYTGIYEVVLEVSDAEGNTDSDRISLVVDEASQLDSFDVEITDIEAGERPLVVIHDAVDQYGQSFEGDTSFEFEYYGREEEVELTFSGGEAEYELEEITEAGEHRFTVEAESQVRSGILTVLPGEVDSVVVIPDEDRIVNTGESLEFEAVGYDEYGNIVTDDVDDFEWDNADIGTFSEESPGDYEVTASYEGVASSPVIVTVEEDDPITVEEDGPGTIAWALGLIGWIVAVAALVYIASLRKKSEEDEFEEFEEEPAEELE